MLEQSTRKAVLNQLIKMPHNKLEEYTDVVVVTTKNDEEFVAKLATWNFGQTKVRDSKIGLSVPSIRVGQDKEYIDNHIAILLSLPPRELEKALDYNRSLKGLGYKKYGTGNYLEGWVEQYIRVRERSPKWWDRVALTNRKTLTRLYATQHIKPSPRAASILFDKQYPVDSAFYAVKTLKDMTPQDAAAEILKWNIPVTTVVGARPTIKTEADIPVVRQMLESATYNQLVGFTKFFESVGVMDNPELKYIYDTRKRETENDSRANVMRAAKAAESIGGATGEALKAETDRMVKKSANLDGDWLVHIDASGSMDDAIAWGRQVSSVLSALVKGKIILTSGDTSARMWDVTGKSLSEIETITRGVRAGGSTSLGCGLALVLQKGFVPEGIVVITDGGENANPIFADVYAKNNLEAMVYEMTVGSYTNEFTHYMRNKSIDFESIDLRKGVDYNSLPEIVKQMRVSKYTLLDEIFAVSLMKPEDVITKSEE